jgi:hypothetical protein
MDHKFIDYELNELIKNIGKEVMININKITINKYDQYDRSKGHERTSYQRWISKYGTLIERHAYRKLMAITRQNISMTIYTSDYEKIGQQRIIDSIEIYFPEHIQMKRPSIIVKDFYTFIRIISCSVDNSDNLVLQTLLHISP